jgi:hypothetical protein
LRLVNQNISRYGPHAHLTDLLDHEFQRIHKLKNTSTHKFKHEMLSQFNIEAGVLVNEPTSRLVQLHCLKDELTNRSVQSYDLGDELRNMLV